MKNSKNSVAIYQNKLFNELYSINTLLNLTKNYCQELEFKVEYYGASKNCIKNFSNERNDYLTMFTIMRNKLNNAISINLELEREFYNKIPTIAADK